MEPLPPATSPPRSPEPGRTAPPALSADLRAALSDLRPVATRHPSREAALVGGLSVAWAAALVLLGVLPWRPDLHELPRLRLVAVLLLATALLVHSLRRALVPPVGQVLPAPSLARWAVGGALLLAVMGLLLAEPAGPESFLPPPGLPRFLRYASSCTRYALLVPTVPAALSLLLLRRRLPLGGLQVGARIGAACGALTALVVSLHCPIVGVAHVGLVHGGQIVVPVLVAALLGHWLLQD